MHAYVVNGSFHGGHRFFVCRWEAKAEDGWKKTIGVVGLDAVLGGDENRAVTIVDLRTGLLLTPGVTNEDNDKSDTTSGDAGAKAMEDK